MNEVTAPPRPVTVVFGSEGETRMGNAVKLELSADEALVLFAFLQRFDDTKRLAVEDQAEERALWNLHGRLEECLVEIFHPDYLALVEAARNRLRDPMA